jgi:hypothetical protein
MIPVILKFQMSIAGDYRPGVPSNDYKIGMRPEQTHSTSIIMVRIVKQGHFESQEILIRSCLNKSRTRLSNYAVHSKALSGILKLLTTYRTKHPTELAWKILNHKNDIVWHVTSSLRYLSA